MGLAGGSVACIYNPITVAPVLAQSRRFAAPRLCSCVFLPSPCLSGFLVAARTWAAPGSSLERGLIGALLFENIVRSTCVSAVSTAPLCLSLVPSPCSVPTCTHAPITKRWNKVVPARRRQQRLAFNELEVCHNAPLRKLVQYTMANERGFRRRPPAAHARKRHILQGMYICRAVHACCSRPRPPQRVLTEKRGFDEPVHHALAGGVSGYLLGAVMTMAGARPVIKSTPRPLDQLDGKRAERGGQPRQRSEFRGSVVTPGSDASRLPTTNPYDNTKSTNLELRVTLTGNLELRLTLKKGSLSIYSTGLYRGVIIPVF